VYDIFETAGGGRLFIGIVTDTQWDVFCREFGEKELAADARLKSNAMRVKERGWLIARLGDIFRKWPQKELEKRIEDIGLPYAPISKPWDLLEDPHLKASGGLFETRIPGGKTIRIPGLPIALDGERLPKRADPPELGGNGPELLRALGCSPEEVAKLVERRIVAFPNGGGGST